MAIVTSHHTVATTNDPQAAADMVEMHAKDSPFQYRVWDSYRRRWAEGMPEPTRWVEAL
jgi:hypothetical protein